MQPYKPSGKVPLVSIVWLVSVLVGAMVWGVLVSIISQTIYLIILFPAAMGALGGGMLSRTIRTSKMRNPTVAILYGVIVAAAIYGSLHYFDYLFFRQGMESIVSQKVANPDLVDPAIDMIIVGETGLPGFLGYLVLAAKHGVSIGHIGTGSLFTLNAPLTVLYWLAEFGIIAYLTASIASFQARKPFSEKRNQWYPAGELLGSITGVGAGELLRLAQIGDFERIGEMIRDNVSVANIFLYLQSLDSSREESIFSASHISRQGSSDIFEAVITPSKTSALKRGMALRKVNPLAV
jgi:hypothetical protein